MGRRTAALAISAALVAGTAGVVALTPASAATSDNPVSSRLAAIKSALTGLVDDGTITQDQADAVADTLDDQLPQRGPGEGGFGRPGHGEAGGPRGGPGLDAAATAMGLTPEELRTALSDGQTIAALAKAQGVPVTEVVQAMVQEGKSQLAAAVDEGRLTQKQADAIASEMRQRIRHMIHSLPQGPPRGLAAPESDADTSAGGATGSTASTATAV